MSGDVFWYYRTCNESPLVTPAFLERQRRRLVSGRFDREHRNLWGDEEGAFITAALWDQNVEPAWEAADADGALPLWVGVDLGIKSDTSAVVGVAYDREDRLVVLARHRLWTPSKDTPLDLAATVEAYIRELAREFAVACVLCDPWQAAMMLVSLRQSGIEAHEYAQTEGGVSRMSERLYTLLYSRGIVLYPSDELRTQALNTVAVEGPRGSRIAKRSASRKIDGIVALALACVALEEVPPMEPLRIGVLELTR